MATSITDFSGGTYSSIANPATEYAVTTGQIKLSYPYAIKDANLVSYWRFEVDETNQTDEVGTNALYKPATAPDWTASGKFGGAYDYVKANTDRLVLSGKSTNGQAGSVSVWVKRKNVTDAIYHTMFGWGTTGNNHLFRFLTVGNGTNWGVHFDTRAAAYHSCTSTLVYDANVWYHVVVTSTGAATVLYINGTANTVGTHGGEWFGDLTASGANWTSIGGWFYQGAWVAGEDSDEIVDGVKVYDDALTGLEVTALYNSGVQYTALGNWISASISNTLKIKSMTITHSGLDVNNFIDKIEILDASDDSIITTYNGNITSGASTTLVASDFTGLFTGTDINYKIKIYLDGNAGTETPVVTQLDIAYITVIKNLNYSKVVTL